MKVFKTIAVFIFFLVALSPFALLLGGYQLIRASQIQENEAGTAIITVALWVMFSLLGVIAHKQSSKFDYAEVLT